MNAATQDIAVPPAPHEEVATAPPLPAASEQQQQPVAKKKKKWSEHIEGSFVDSFSFYSGTLMTRTDL
eukprot:scaffold96544_cov22-Cyclotella_meneghiniana.AAC.1